MCLWGFVWYRSYFDLRVRNFLTFASFALTRDDGDDFFGVVRDEPRVAEAVNEIFRAKVVIVNESNPHAFNADKKALWVRRLSSFLCQWVIPNRRFRLGIG